MSDRKKKADSSAPATENVGKSASRSTRLPDPNSAFCRSFPILFFIFSVLLLLCLVFPSALGAVGHGIRNFFLGLFGPAVFLLPFLQGYLAVRFREDVKNRNVVAKWLSSFLFLVFLAVMFFTFGLPADEQAEAFAPAVAYTLGQTLTGGGVLGNLLGYGLLRLISVAGIVIFFCIVFLLFLICTMNFDPKAFCLMIGKKFRQIYRRRVEKRAALKEEQRQKEEKLRVEKEAAQNAMAAAREKAAQEEAARKAAEAEKAAQQDAARRMAAAFAEGPSEPGHYASPAAGKGGRTSIFAETPSSREADIDGTFAGNSADYPLDNDIFFTDPKKAEQVTPIRPLKKDAGGRDTSYDFLRRQKENTIRGRSEDLSSYAPKTLSDFAKITTTDPRTQIFSSRENMSQIHATRSSLGGFPSETAQNDMTISPMSDIPVEKGTDAAPEYPFRRDTVAFPTEAAGSPQHSPEPFQNDRRLPSLEDVLAPSPEPEELTSGSGSAGIFTDRKPRTPSYTPPYSNVPEEGSPSFRANDSYTAEELRSGNERFQRETARPFGAFSSPVPSTAPATPDMTRPNPSPQNTSPAFFAPAAERTGGGNSFSSVTSYYRTPQSGNETEEKRGFDFSSYRYPDISFLVPQDRSDEGVLNAEVAENMERLIRTLKSYGVEAEPRSTTRGPRITRYEIVPALGVRINAITNLQNEIAMNLRAESLRIEAPIPGDSAIGIEVPNQTSKPVRLRGLIDTEEFRNAKDKTTIALGADIAGKFVFTTISGMPHMLVAGATGMGKSVCINTIITSLLYKARPDEVRLILVDPKMVEFNIYQGIPHLLVPVINNAKQALGALNWAAEEMDRRFGIISHVGARDLDGYNKVRDTDPSLECLPRIVIVIDELNDLILSLKNSKPLDDVICRIAQKARAAGIHLLIGTQRPTVNVLTGNIKANISARIAFKVNQKVDSTTIIDAVGAERLLDKGDMLFMKSSKTRRIQCCLVDEKEIEKVVTFLRSNSDGDTYDRSAMAGIDRATSAAASEDSGAAPAGGMTEGGHVSPEERQFWEAVDTAVTSGKVATSFLQRKLSVGYGKAAKLIDRMEELGIVSAQDEKKAREVLMSADEVAELRARLTGRDLFTDDGEEDEDI